MADLKVEEKLAKKWVFEHYHVRFNEFSEDDSAF
jgi:hypothetical protein